MKPFNVLTMVKPKVREVHCKFRFQHDDGHVREFEAKNTRDLFWHGGGFAEEMGLLGASIGSKGGLITFRDNTRGETVTLEVYTYERSPR